MPRIEDLLPLQESFKAYIFVPPVVLRVLLFLSSFSFLPSSFSSLVLLSSSRVPLSPPQVPVSVMAIGMGLAMMDFVVREARYCVDGPLAFVR